ncbi:MAG: hypothetical protein ABI425_01615 [Patescibacteria group bacterium]
MMDVMQARSTLTSRLLVLVIVILGLFVRTINVNWDQNQHLHPDERFLTMVMGGMQVPHTVREYLDPELSTFNPTNVGFKFFVYGTFPLVINKFVAIALHNDNYNMLTLQGRWLSAAMDAVAVLTIILITRQFEKKYGLPRNLKYFAGLFYAIAVFPIQQAHFFTVDTFANTFFLLSVLSALKLDRDHFLRASVISGIIMGLAVASKINVVLGAPLIGWLLIETFVQEAFQHRKAMKMIISIFIVSLFWLGSFWITLRVAEPYYFSHFSLIDWHLNTTFLGNIKQLQSFNDPAGYFPPGIQWGSKTAIIFPLVNIAFFGLGLPLFFFAVVGFGKLGFFSFRELKTRVGLFFTLLWMVVFFSYEGIQFVLTMRYFLFLYPFFALCAGYGLMEIGKLFTRKASLSNLNHEWLVLSCSVLCFIWPLMFMSIYLHKNSRVEASEWMYRVLPDKSVIALEHWDDPLPLQVEGANPDQKDIKGLQLPVFYPDDDVKWTEMNDILGKSDYYVLTSNRGWGSIMAAPKKYPKMSQFYKDLFDGKTEFEKIAEFTSYPGLSYLGLPITINDDWSEEAFTVYDHPKVLIFAKKK